MTDHIGIDPGDLCGDFQIEELYVRPTAEYPQGSWLYKIGDRVEAATGFYEKEYPGHPSPYFHGGAPFVILDTTPPNNWVMRRWKEPKALLAQDTN